MKDLLEATEETARQIAEKPGTHYVHVLDYNLAGFRKMLGDAVDAAKTYSHTSYNHAQRTLRVVISSKE